MHTVCRPSVTAADASYSELVDDWDEPPGVYKWDEPPGSLTG